MIRVGRWSELAPHLLSRTASPEVRERVEEIVRDVEERGWEALREWSLRLDGIEPAAYTRREMEEEWRRLPPRLAWALSTAARRIREVHEAQLPQPVEAPGPVAARTVWRPLRVAAIYAPGGRHPYPSTLLMAAIPARVAGVEHVAAASPLKTPEARRIMLAAARLAEVDVLLSAGGAQAVAALALGLAAPPADKIVGPGGPYVQEAKRLLQGKTGIDMVAGPTELVAISDGTGDPEDLALDLAAQAEHGPGGLSLLLDTEEEHLRAVGEALEPLHAPGHADIYLALVDSIGEAVEAANRVAPEHLLIYTRNPSALLPRVVNAGAVSLGTPPALLDYTAGTNHILPTGGWARWRGGLTVYDYLKPVYVVEGLDEELAEAAAEIAEAEGMKLHAESIKRRLQNI